MAQPPLTFLERKWQTSQTNDLVQAATQNTDRLEVPNLDKDTHRNISKLGRLTLLAVGRFLYWNCDVIRGAVDEIARLAVGTFIPQYYGRNKGWGKLAEEWLYEHDKFCDIRGWPYNMDHLNRNLVVEVIVDGDFGILLTERDSVPKFQTWRAHRIGGRNFLNGTVVGGRYDGARIIDGVVVDEFGAAMAYAIVGEDPWSTTVQYVSANDFLLNFLPSVSDQLRGPSLLGVSAFNWQDVKESRGFELMAQKIGATYGMQVMNETGEVDRAKKMVQAPGTAADSSGNAQDLPKEIHKPGKILYFKAGTNQKIEQVKNERPSQNFMAFQDEIIRSGLESLGWSFDFAHNPTKIGGAPMRVVVDRLNRRLEEIRTLLVKPVRRRLDGYRVAKAIKSGFLPEDPDWFKWDYQGPAEMTGDRKYDSTIDLEETARGFTTEQRSIAKRGGYWEDVHDGKELAGDDKLMRAERIAKKYGITIQEAFAILWMPTPNGPISAPGETGGATEEKETPMATE